MGNSKSMSVFGKLFTGGQVYSLLNPQPVAKDSCWGVDTYAFYVANPRGEATTVVTNSFSLEYIGTEQKIMVSGVLEVEPTPIPEFDENPSEDWADREPEDLSDAWVIGDSFYDSPELEGDVYFPPVFKGDEWLASPEETESNDE